MAPTWPTPTKGANYGVSATAKSIASATWAAGDLVVVMGVTGDNSNTLTNPPTASGLTFASATNFPTNTASRMKHYFWSATAASGGSGAITDAVSSADEGGVIGYVISNHGGLGASPVPVTAAGPSAPSMAITTTGPNSAILCSWSAWNRATGARTYLSVNGAPTEDGYIDTATYGTSAHFSYADAGAAGAKTVGVSAPSATNWFVTAVEILAAATGAAAVTGPTFNPIPFMR